MTARLHCPACGEGVDSYDVDLGGLTETRCLSCGLPLERRLESGATRFRRVLVADDSAFFTEGVTDFLSARGLAGEVLRAGDGGEAVAAVTGALRDRRPLDLVVLDLLMPRLDGFHAAIATRAVEQAFRSPRSAILFLSSRRIDPKMKPLLHELAPAYYLNKGAGGQLLGRRLEEVLRAIGAAIRRRAG